MTETPCRQDEQAGHLEEQAGHFETMRKADAVGRTILLVEGRSSAAIWNDPRTKLEQELQEAYYCISTIFYLLL